MYKICFYVPITHADQVKDAMFACGAGKIGNYSRCAWQVAGVGQFCPEDGSNPYLGNTHQLETVQEYKVEMVCDAQYIQAVIDALKKTHPYEEPAYQAWRIDIR